MAGLVWVVVAGGSDSGDDADEPYVVPSATSQARTVRPDAAVAALDGLVAALRSGDVDAAAALAPADDPDAAQRLVDLVDVARAARIDDVGLRYLDEIGGLDDADTWSASVDTTWSYRGFDPTPAAAEIEVSFRLDGADGARIVRVGGGTDPEAEAGTDARRTPVWMSGAVEVRRTPQTLVLVSGTPREAATYARLARRAVPVVDEVVTDWTPRLVVEVPADLTALDRALGAADGDYAGIAAVTTSGDGSTAPDAPVHVFVNPEVYGGLRGVGAQVVMSHEATHVATQAPSSQAPTWLLEGFADYVALRDVTLPLTTTAGQIRERVVRDGLPEALPSAADFDTEAPHLGAVYEAAWLLCVTLADRGGQQALLDLYDTTSTGAGLDDALRRLFDWSPDELLEAWRTRLSDLARDRA